jgi:hypothetical protein
MTEPRGGMVKIFRLYLAKYHNELRNYVFVFKCLFLRKKLIDKTLIPAPYIKPCNYDDATTFATCVKEQIVESLPYFTKGIPELGVTSLDPVILEDIVIDGNGLKLSLNKGQLHGLSTAVVNELK